MANQEKIYLRVPIQSGTLNTNYPSTSGYYNHIYLDAGFRYYVEEARLTAGTTLAAGTTATCTWYLYDEDGNVICSYAGTSALTGTGVAMGSFSSTYRDIDATDAAELLKFGYTVSGGGQQPWNLCLHITLVKKAPIAP